MGIGFWKLSDQLLNVPVPPLVELFVITNVHVPSASSPANADSGICGLNVPKRCAAVLDRRSRVVIEYRIGEIGVLDAGPDAAE